MSVLRARTAERFFRDGDSLALRQGRQTSQLGKLGHDRDPQTRQRPLSETP